METKPHSITLFATLFIGFFLLIVGMFGFLTYREVINLEEDFRATSLTKANQEIEHAVHDTIVDIEAYTRNFASWEEVGQQLQNRIFYAYWYRHRAINRNILPNHVIDVAVYDAEGDVLSKIDNSQLPEKIDRNNLTPQIVSHKGTPLVCSSTPVMDPATDSVIGYTSLLSSFKPSFFRFGRFSQIDQESIHFNLQEQSQFDWPELLSKIHFKLRNDPLAEALKELMTQAVVRLGVMLGVFTLLFFPLSAWLIGRPIRQISQHIDMLKNNSYQPIPEAFENRLPILELDKVRESLNDYHVKLNEVNSSLDEKNRELWNLAHHDPLTGVKNRRAFDDYCREIRHVFTDIRSMICLALIDINHFKAINDTYGHQVGDDVLIAISQAVRGELRKGEYLFRLGGDEFAAVLINCPPNEARQIAERWLQAITSHPFDKLGIKEPVRVSIGLSHSNAENLGSLLTLQWQADVAMYSAKRPGKSHIAQFTPEMAEGAKGLFSNWTHNAVYEAVNHGTGLVMHYQPIVKLQDGKVQYYEALVRIVRDDKIIMPSHIFPLVEARRLELDLDRMVINKIRDDLKNHLFPDNTGISINLSAPAVVDKDIIRQLASFRQFVNGYRLVLEITETALITQIKTATKNLTELRKLGFNIALDDFGSGYSSLRYLGQMPVDIVKFDISLTQLVDDPAQQPILGHLTKMIEESGYCLVAEGVDSLALAHKLQALGFELGQGYCFGNPQPAHRLAT